jgi:two-component sensor histidine kinase
MMQHSAPDGRAAAEMAGLVRAMDWSKTLLGPSDQWPPSLTLIVSVLLSSGFPMCVRWGPDFVMVYNDGYRSILGDKHPAALGQPFHQVWPEVQSQLRSLHEDILAGRSGAFFAEDLLIKVQRHGKEWENGRFTVSYSPVPDGSAPTGVGGVLITVVETTDRVRTEEALRLAQDQLGMLVQELNHRIKNLFAITGGMISLSARSASTPEEYAANIQGRLNALALAHDLILPSAATKASPEAQPIGLDALLQKVLSPYIETPDGATRARLVFNGPPVPLGPRAVTTLALVLHELATNAAKYGALSVPGGSLDVEWSCVDDNLILKWSESGGPELAGPPKAEGFGTVLSNHSVRGQLGGTLSNHWNADGLVAVLSIPLQRLSI